jgi:hypothetical protein
VKPLTEKVLKYSNQYLLVLKPATQVVEKINELRNLIHEDFKTEIFPLSFPYVRLISFTGLKENEQHLINHLVKIGRQLSPVQLILKDFGNFPTHTLFINVASKVSLIDRINFIKKEGKLSSFTIEQPQYIDDFYIPVAIKLKPWQFETLSVESYHLNFSASCIINEIQLLIREQNTGRLRCISKFPLQNLIKKTSQQGLLF